MEARTSSFNFLFLTYVTVIFVLGMNSSVWEVFFRKLLLSHLEAGKPPADYSQSLPARTPEEAGSLWLPQASASARAAQTLHHSHCSQWHAGSWPDAGTLNICWLGGYCFRAGWPGSLECDPEVCRLRGQGARLPWDPCLPGNGLACLKVPHPRKIYLQEEHLHSSNPFYDNSSTSWNYLF